MHAKSGRTHSELSIPENCLNALLQGMDDLEEQRHSLLRGAQAGALGFATVSAEQSCAAGKDLEKLLESDETHFSWPQLAAKRFSVLLVLMLLQVLHDCAVILLTVVRAECLFI